jgi:hypothetical protein
MDAGDLCGHRWGFLQRPVPAAEIVMGNEQRDANHQVIKLLAEPERQPEALQKSSNRQVHPLTVRSTYVEMTSRLVSISSGGPERPGISSFR